jgi:hypothetical protein
MSDGLHKRLWDSYVKPSKRRTEPSYRDEHGRVWLRADVVCHRLGIDLATLKKLDRPSSPLPRLHRGAGGYFEENYLNTWMQEVKSMHPDNSAAPAK